LSCHHSQTYFIIAIDYKQATTYWDKLLPINNKLYTITIYKNKYFGEYNRLGNP